MNKGFKYRPEYVLIIDTGTCRGKYSIDKFYWRIN